MESAKIIVLILLVICAHTVQGQMRRGGKKLKKVVCPIENGKDLNFSLGARIGDPYGVTAKMYFPERLAVELIAGRTFPGLHDEANEEVFNAEIELPHDQSEYLGHEIRKMYTGQLRMVYHLDFPNYEGLDWYVALGGQIRYFEIHYVFEFMNSDPPSANVGSIDDPFTRVGPELSMGVEYVIPYRTMSSFAEVGVFGDVFNGGLDTQFFGGLGVRYNF
ncbi:hypothetical protein QQ020_28415 [Fulvivirgaceae bacterium BMA12]|uniref:Outer membrane protein beta-barrel domain-containing protein n=1 Tax=Agaribacillus aureus TaxID=3051825 RepID=A0ABT8LI41_9BACT|nr:hypothetical protein [Fulvivirgaceae bacterium BMA12]